MRKTIISITLLSIACSSFAAGQPRQFTLKEAVLIALRFNPSVRTAELQRTIDKFGLEVAKNNYELRYALSGSAQYNDKRTSGLDSNDKSLSLNPNASLLTASGATVILDMNNKVDKNYYNPGVGLTIKQPLLRGFGNEITLTPLANAYDQEKINRLNLKRAVINTITVVINDYLRIVQSENSLTTQELALKNSLKEYEQNKLKIKAGKMAAADNIRQEAAIASLRLSLLQAQNSLEQARQQLLLDMGLDPKTQFTIAKDVALPHEELPSLDTAAQLVLQNDIDYQTSLINRQIQARNLTVSKDNLRWQLDLTAKTMLGNGSGGYPNSGLASINNNQNYGRSVQLDLKIPIDDKKLQQAVLNDKINLQKADILLKQQQYTLETNVINALRNLHIQKQQIQQAVIARDLAQRSLDVALKKLQFGLVSTFETTSLRTDLTKAELEVVNSQIGFLSALATFQQALGTTLDVWGIGINY